MALRARRKTNWGRSVYAFVCRDMDTRIGMLGLTVSFSLCVGVFGWKGVYVPCLLNIIGVILFLRLGWGVGQAGVEGIMLIFVLAETQAVLTVLSACTIASNGAMQGGGSYFLIR